MVVFPPAKINLGLHVLRKRSDGYHDLETCFYPIPLCDILEIIIAPEFSFTTSGNGIPGADVDNLCIRAYKLMREKFDIPPVAIHLHKIIPTGAGLGGGSSDAAHTLTVINKVCGLNLSNSDLLPFAAQLGSDCSFFIENTPMIGVGRGEQLSTFPISLEGYFIVLVKPAVHVSTAEAYARIKPDENTPSLTAILSQPVSAWRDILKNDFETAIFPAYPIIADIKRKLYDKGALYACMSGSGSTVFGIFEKPVDLEKDFAPAFYFQYKL